MSYPPVRTVVHGLIATAFSLTPEEMKRKMAIACIKDAARTNFYQVSVYVAALQFVHELSNFQPIKKVGTQIEGMMLSLKTLHDKVFPVPVRRVMWEFIRQMKNRRMLETELVQHVYKLGVVRRDEVMTLTLDENGIEEVVTEFAEYANNPYANNPSNNFVKAVSLTQKLSTPIRKRNDEPRVDATSTKWWGRLGLNRKPETSEQLANVRAHVEAMSYGEARRKGLDVVNAAWKLGDDSTRSEARSTLERMFSGNRARSGKPARARIRPARARIRPNGAPTPSGAENGSKRAPRRAGARNGPNGAPTPSGARSNASSRQSSAERV